MICADDRDLWSVTPESGGRASVASRNLRNEGAASFVGERGFDVDDDSALARGVDSVQDSAYLGPIVSCESSPLRVDDAYTACMVAANAHFRFVEQDDVLAWMRESGGVCLACVEQTYEGSIGPHVGAFLKLMRAVQLNRNLTGLVVSTEATRVIWSSDGKHVTGLQRPLRAGLNDVDYLADDGPVCTSYGVPVFDVSLERRRVAQSRSSRYVDVDAVEVVVCVFAAESVLRGERQRTLFNVAYALGRSGVDLWGLVRRTVSHAGSVAALNNALGREADGVGGATRLTAKECVVRPRMLESILLREAECVQHFRLQLNGSLAHPLRSAGDSESCMNVYNLMSPFLVMWKITAMLDAHSDVIVYGFPTLGRSIGGCAGTPALRARAASDYMALYDASQREVALYAKCLRKGVQECRGLKGDELAAHFVDLRSPRYMPLNCRDGQANTEFGVLTSNVSMWFRTNAMQSWSDSIENSVSVKAYPGLVDVAVGRFFHRGLHDVGDLPDARLGERDDLLTEYKLSRRYNSATGGKLDDVMVSGQRLEFLLATERQILDGRASGQMTPAAALLRYFGYVELSAEVTRAMIADGVFGSTRIADAHRAAASLSTSYAPKMSAAVAMYGLSQDRGVYQQRFAAPARVVCEYEGGGSAAVPDARYTEALRALQVRKLWLVVKLL